MKRFKHSLTHDHLITFDLGQLVPIANVPILPGDSIQAQSSALLRFTPQLKPIMHNVQAHIAHFFVPYRLVWSGWEDFITGESATPPPIIAGQAYAEGTLQDYLGVYDDASNDYNALAVRAYNLIFNHYFRDQDLVTEVSEDSLVVQKVAWAKDYFTSARPWPQKGGTVTLPIGDSAPVHGIGVTPGTTFTTTSQSADETDNSGQTYANARASNATSIWFEQDPSNANHPNIRADLSAATGVDIREFREAFAMQRYAEARAKYGSEYVDYLRYLGVRPSDARLRRPEFLAAGRTMVNFSEVLNTGSLASGILGALGGHGIAAMRSNRFRRFFEEHGVMLSLMYVRPKSIYGNGLAREWSKTTKEDYYQRELESVGAQEILNKEVYAPHSDPDGVFGFADRYSEYRSMPSRVSGEFRNATSYDWHFARLFSSDPALNATFVTCDPTKRVFAEQSEHAVQCVVHNSIQARRMVSRSVKGGIL